MDKRVSEKGDTAAFKELLDRYEGKADQAIELGNLDDKPLDLTVIDLVEYSTEKLIRMIDEENKREQGGELWRCNSGQQLSEPAHIKTFSIFILD
ncbi:MAG: hypothetical protein INR73_05670 [Williamsia sp.]|nr:hypothetical protein [Williamsia sp.]